MTSPVYAAELVARLFAAGDEVFDGGVPGLLREAYESMLHVTAAQPTIVLTLSIARVVELFIRYHGVIKPLQVRRKSKRSGWYGDVAAMVKSAKTTISGRVAAAAASPGVVNVVAIQLVPGEKTPWDSGVRLVVVHVQVKEEPDHPCKARLFLFDDVDDASAFLNHVADDVGDFASLQPVSVYFVSPLSLLVWLAQAHENAFDVKNTYTMQVRVVIQVELLVPFCP